MLMNRMNRMNRQSTRKRNRLWSTLALIAAILFWANPIQVYANPENTVSDPEQHPSKLEQQVQVWVNSLVKQKPFSVWQSVDPQIEALGPGTHSWLVLFTKEGKDIGYMVVHAVTDGTFQLGEYGLGPYSLFSQQLLKRSLIDNGILSEGNHHLLMTTKHYLHPFAAIWEVTIGEDRYWLDAKTAELLPFDAKTWQETMTESSFLPSMELPTSTDIHSLLLNDSFDAYERLPWLTKEAPFPVKNSKKLQIRLSNKQHLRYVIEPFGVMMLYAIPVIGYQHWTNGRMDIAFDMEGTRFVPFETLRVKGLFYR